MARRREKMRGIFRNIGLKRAVVLLLAIAVVAASFGWAAPVSEQRLSKPQTRSFTDSLGRTVELPVEIDKVAVSGPLAQIALFAICPDELVGIANAWDSTAAVYFDSKYYNLPILGQLYGGKGQLNLETLLASGAQVVVDVGEPKKTAKDDLDALQAQTGIPFVHVTLTTAHAGDAYRKLGELLGKPDEAEKLAEYCDETYEKFRIMASNVDKVNLLYLTGSKGLNVIANGSFHAEVIDLLSNNIAVVDDPTSKGTGNEVDMEQILAWNPDVVIFAPQSIYEEVASDEIWKDVAAIQNNAYCKVPYGPYNWLGFPPSVQRYLGMMWMAKLLYPEAADYDLYQEAARYFELFYHCGLTRQQYDALVEDSIGRK